MGQKIRSLKPAWVKTMRHYEKGKKGVGVRKGKREEKVKFCEVYTQTHTHTHRCIYIITTLMTETSIARLIIE